MIEQVLARGRAASEARMLDDFDIVMPGPWRAVDGKDVRTDEPLFTTKGRVKVSGGLRAARTEAGERTVVTVTRELHIPVGSPAVPAGAVAVCTAVDPTTDPSLVVGARLHLQGPAPGSQTTARRLTVTEVLT